MSHTHRMASSSSSNFQIMINNALDTYKKRTKNDLLAHPLATQLQICNSPGAIIVVLQEQVQGLDRSRRSDERWSKWLDPTVNVIQAFSLILEVGANMVCFRTYCRILRGRCLMHELPGLAFAYTLALPALFSLPRDLSLSCLSYCTTSLLTRVSFTCHPYFTFLLTR